MLRFYHVFIQPKEGVSLDQIEQKMNLALDWFRYASGIWIIFTSKNIDEWQLRLKPFVDSDGSLFICQLNPDETNGWMVKDFWEWIKKNKARQKE